MKTKEVSTTSQIVTKNIKVAAFMGYTQQIVLEKGKGQGVLENAEWNRVAKPDSRKDWKEVDHLNYDLSWNEFMKVYAKINQMAFGKINNQQKSLIKQVKFNVMNANLPLAFETTIEFIDTLNIKTTIVKNDFSSVK